MEFFPQGMKVVYPYDTTPFVKISINEVVKTLIEAIIPVFPVMYLFLQNFRATLIPTIAVPVLLGTFAILAAFGFSINTLTMFGMVLAIGLLVDDAIVVVENVERVMAEEGLPPKEATRKSMGQIQWRAGGYRHGAVGGIRADGVLRRFNRRHLSPVLDHHRVRDGAVGAGGLDPDTGAVRHHAQTDPERRSRVKTGFFGWFNRMFEKSTHHYTDSVGNILRSTGRYLIIYLLIVVGMGLLFLRLPSSFRRTKIRASC